VKKPAADKKKPADTKKTKTKDAATTTDTPKRMVKRNGK
jgi:hypothetical protein